jgi:hypothetical protein
LSCRAPSTLRSHTVAELRRILAAEAPLTAIDHNRPRRQWAAMLAIVWPPRPRGGTPAGRWRRLAYPTARELRDAGFDIEKLRLTVSERVQVVVSRLAGPPRGSC